MNKDTKLAIELITGHEASSQAARTVVFDVRGLIGMFFSFFISPNNGGKGKGIICGVNMSKVGWDMVFEKVVVNNIIVKGEYKTWTLPAGKEASTYEIKIRVNNKL